MHSMSIEEHHHESSDEEGANDFRKTIMVGDKANDLAEISVDEAILDIDMPDPPAPESESTAHPQRVLSEDDLVGKTASITYNDNLLDLAMHLKLPVQQCTFEDRVLDPERGKYKAWGIQHSLDIWHAAKSLNKRLRRKLDEDSQNKPWIIQGSAAHKALTAVVLEKRWLTLVKKFLNFRMTNDKHKLFVLSSYRQKYNKKSKSWSVYTMKVKQYTYIPEIQRAILARRLGSGSGLPRKQTLRPDDPRRLGVLAPQ
ncbi:unnamed protein product [Leuciscus chuanchicus]